MTGGKRKPRYWRPRTGRKGEWGWWRRSTSVGGRGAGGGRDVGGGGGGRMQNAGDDEGADDSYRLSPSAAKIC